MEDTDYTEKWKDCHRSAHGCFPLPCVRCIPWFIPSVQHGCL